MLQGAEASGLIEVATEQSYNAVLITDGELSADGPWIVYCNPAFCRMTGYARDELIGRSPRLLQGPDTDPAVIDSLRRALRQGVFWEGSTVNYRKGGEAYIVNWNISPVLDSDQRVTHFVSVQQDITARVQAEAERDMLVQALNQASEPVLVTDRQGLIVFANHAFEALSGYDLDEVRGQTPALLSSGAQPPDFYREMWQTLVEGRSFRARFLNCRKDGSRYHVEQSIAPVLDGQGRITHFVSTSWQVDELVEREKALVDMATRDQLTGLLTRRAGDEALRVACQHYRVQAVPLSLILCDIDHFKQVNDRHGHLAGDRIIQQVARMLQEHFRASDPTIRWGGEEFLVIVQASSTVAMRLAERLRIAIEQFRDAQVGPVTISLGVAEVTQGETLEQLLGRADDALYRAKHGGRNRTVVATQ